MFEHHYQAELSYLRDMGKSFAAKHPALAGMLSDRGTDPDVERLLEGFAFVAARLRQRIDDAAPELVETLAELLTPHVLRPTPAASIVELRPAAKTLRGPVKLERGTRMLSVPVRGTRCTFTTSRAVEVLPVRLVSCRLDDSAASRPELTLRLEAEPGCEACVFRREGLRFQLHGELAVSAQMHLWLARHLSNVTLRAANGDCVELGPRAVQFPGFGASDALLPWPAFSPHGARLLLEYFALPSKFLCCEITQLDRALHMASSSFELVLRFDRPPPLPARLPEDALRLHCVPVVNLFDVAADPLRAELDERAALLRASDIHPLHAEVFSVESVVGVSRGAERRVYAPFHSFAHARAGAPHACFYKLSRQPSPVDDGTHTFLSLQTAVESEGSPDNAGPVTLSIELRCTNRDLPLELQVGDICLPTSDLPSALAFSNISRVSMPARAPLGSDLPWHFLSHVACTRRSLADLDVLRALLSLYGPQEHSDFAEARVKRAKIDAIRSVQVESITRVIAGVAARGSLYRIELDQSGFSGDGDAYLFGSVLHQLLAIGAQLNTFADLRVTLVPSAVEWRFLAELPS